MPFGFGFLELIIALAMLFVIGMVVRAVLR